MGESAGPEKGSAPDLEVGPEPAELSGAGPGAAGPDAAAREGADGANGGLTAAAQVQLQRMVVAGKRAPTVAAQTERRDRKVVAAMKALAAQRYSLKGVGTISAFADGMNCVWMKLVYYQPVARTRAFMGFSRPKPEELAYRKKIVMNMSGRAEPGNFLAIMGPEGSGKTLLLHMLAGRMRGDPNFQGSVLYNGQPWSESLRREIGLAENDEELEDNLTVKETLMYAAQLRLPEGTEEIDRIVRVEHVLDSLELTQVADVVLRSGAGIDGGRAALLNERRRLSIGIQMLVNPPLLLLDEPTSGLDGAMALRLSRALNSYALAGRTVIASMKQPSNRMFSFFTHLLLVAEGNPIYFGSASKALQHFDSLGYNPSHESSPAEFFLDLSAPEAPDASIHFGTTTNLVRLWHTSETARALDQGLPPPQDFPTLGAGLPPTIEESASFRESSRAGSMTPSMATSRGASEREGEGGGEGRKSGRKEQSDWTTRWVTSWWFQFRVLLARHWQASMHGLGDNVAYFAFTTGSLVLCAVLAGMLWFQRDNNSIGIRDQIGLIFFVELFWGLIPMLATVITFLEKRKVVQKELEDGVYHVSAFYASRTLVYLPFEVIPPVLFSVVVYWMAGLNPWAGAFVLFTLTLILDCLVASSIGFFIGALSETVRHAIWAAAVVQLLNIMVVHFLVLDPPTWIGWTQYLSFSNYVYKLLLRVNFPDTPSCSLQTTEAGSTVCSYDSSSTAVDAASVPWELQELPGSGALEAVVLLLFLIVFRLLALVVLRLRLQRNWRLLPFK